jgi:hypothetical protein
MLCRSKETGIEKQEETKPFDEFNNFFAYMENQIEMALTQVAFRVCQSIRKWRNGP